MASWWSGIWEGSYKPNIDKIPLAMTLVFKHPGTVSGTGLHQTLGGYSVEGVYSAKAPYSARLKLIFSGNQEKNLSLEGFRDSSGSIFGTVSGSSSGSFTISPVKEGGGELAKKIKEESEKLTRSTLESMGFPSYLIEHALNQCSTLESAVNWCTQNMTGGMTTSSGSVDEEKLMNLISMGFDDSVAREVLLKHNNNLDQAVEELLGQTF